MKKRFCIKWVVLGVVVALFWCLVYALVTTLPFYPGFQKNVGSYKKLQRALEDYPDIYMPSLIDLALTDEEYYLILDGRTIYAHPKGYAFGGSLLRNGVEVHYGIQCDKGEIDLSSADTSYRGVPLLYELNKMDNRISFQFTLDNYYYYFGAHYDGSILTKEKTASLNDTIKVQLFELTQQVIDSYLDQTQPIAASEGEFYEKADSHQMGGSQRNRGPVFVVGRRNYRLNSCLSSVSKAGWLLCRAPTSAER